jgi:hypothetical protein
MRTVLGLLVLSAATAAGAAEGGNAEGDFSQVRLSMGLVSGYGRDKVEQSTLNGVRDPQNDGTRELKPRVGIDFQPSLALGHEIDEGWGLVFDAGMVLRTPGATYSSVTDTGLTNSAGTGNVQRTDRMRVYTVLFGGQLAVGPNWNIGSARLELTPFAGAGAAWGRFLVSRVFSNDPLNLFAAQNANAHYTDRGQYFEYGATMGLYWRVAPWAELGFTGGYQATRTVIKIDQHGPVFDQVDHHFEQNGFIFDATAIWNF